MDPHFEGWFNGTTLHVWMLQKRLHAIYGKSPNNSVESAKLDHHPENSSTEVTEKITEQDAALALDLSQEMVRHVWLDVEIKLAQG